MARASTPVFLTKPHFPMYDYKLREQDPSFRKPKRGWRKTALLAAGILFALGILYAVAQLMPPWQEDSQAPEASSDSIPLPLPPYADPEKGAIPIDSGANDHGASRATPDHERSPRP
jgi:hypothetical protein